MVYRAGIIGLGMIGERMLLEFIEHPQFEVRSIWDINPTITDKVTRSYPSLHVAESAEFLINHDDIDLIYIATPPVTHIPYGHQVIEAGKAMLCEKPLGIDLAESRALVERVEAKGLVNAINFAYGAGPVVEKIESQLKSDKFGQPVSIEVRYQFPQWPLPNQLSAASWITRRSEGGLVREMFSHSVYLTLRLVGSIKVLSKIVHFPANKTDAETFVLASLQSNGIPFHFMGGVGGPAAPRSSEWTIHGTERSLQLSEGDTLRIAQNGPWTELEWQNQNRSTVAYRLDELARMLNGEKTRMPGLREGLEVQEVVEAILN
jgi:predicted dehydrogenase